MVYGGLGLSLFRIAAFDTSTVPTCWLAATSLGTKPRHLLTAESEYQLQLNTSTRLLPVARAAIRLNDVKN